MHIINKKELSRTPLREKALLIAEAGYDAIDIEKAVSQKIKFQNNKLSIAKGITGEYLEFDLSDYKKVFLIGIGKGSSLAVMTLAGILAPLGSRFSGGIALDIKIPNKSQSSNSKIEFLTGTHPIPSKQNIEATQKIIKLVKSLDENDLLIAFICGGGSALFCCSEQESEESALAIKFLTKAGADIFELNTIRKHLSECKGGGLAKTAYPATVISLIASDVCGNDLSIIASGPTVFDETTKKDAEKVLQKYELDLNQFHLSETPKDKKYFEKVKNILFVCNQDAISAMVEKAKEIGFEPRIYSLELRGEAKDVLIPMIKEVKSGEAILAGGETTITLGSGPTGKGGRNMESVLGAITNFQEVLPHGVVALSMASDGRDNTEAAGAIVDASTQEKTKELGLSPEEFLENHSSFNFFEKTGDLIFTDQKSFNIADLMVILKI
ncbi:MAG: DUF4147 domain-containing protein [Candidatus Paceibacterota bacterium]